MKIGIDYGTTTTLVSLTSTTKRRTFSQILDIGSGMFQGAVGYQQSTIPSVIGVDRTGNITIGYEAEMLSKSNPGDIILLRSLKRCLGCNTKEGDTNSNCWNQTNRNYCCGGQKLRLFNQTISVRKLVSKFLNEVYKLQVVERALNGKTPSSVGISVPAIFGSQPRHTIYELMLENFKDKIPIDVVNEPTAAIIACQKSMLEDKNGLYVMLDVGGGTTDIVVYEKKDTSYFLFKPSGIRIAGDDVDNALLRSLHQKSFNSPNERDRALMEVRMAKEDLTLSNRRTIFGQILTRQRFEEIVTPVLLQIIGELKKSIKVVFDHYQPFSQTKKPLDFKRIYLSGGGARIPLLKRLIENDEYIKTFKPEVDFVRNKELYQKYGDDLPIFVVALGTSMPKGGISDTIQFMMPYAINVTIGNQSQEKVPIYAELPIEFEIVNPQGLEIHINAVNPNEPGKIVHRLTDELVSTRETRETLLSEFLKKSSSFRIMIDKYNIMRVTTLGLPRPKNRPFPLPWQGGIELSLFEKYRREWRKRHGYH